jgi:integrin beta 3
LGIDDLEEEYQDDGRILIRRYIRDGEVLKEFKFTTCIPIYRGVYKEGQNYLRGDTVTWSGSMWTCQVPTTTGPRDGHKEWTLSTKRGASGKDGKNGRDGAPGPQGPQGKQGERVWVNNP